MSSGEYQLYAYIYLWMKNWKHMLQNTEQSCCGGRGMQQLVTLRSQSGSKDWQMLHSAAFLSFQPRVPALVKGRASDLSSISLEIFWETQAEVCLLILNLAK